MPAEDIAVLELSSKEETEAHADRVLLASPDVVGLSCYVWNITALLELSAELRRRRPDLLIVLGGPEVGPVARDVLRDNPQINVIVRSEGEFPFEAIVRAFRDGSGFSEVPGICYRSPGVVHETPEATILRDLNELPSPHQERYATFVGRSVSIETQRGCVFRCSFCFYNKDLSIRNRRFDLDRVKREILFWLDRDILELFLMDPVFNLNANRAKDICRFIAQHNHRRVPVHAEIWAEFVDDELARLMAAASVAHLEVGLQTTDEAVLASVERRLRLEPFLRGLEHLRAHGLRYELQLIYGLPGETPETFRAALDFAADLDPPRLSIFMLMVLPGTELWRQAAQMGLAYQTSPPYYVQSHASMSIHDIEFGWRLIEAQRRFRRSVVVQLLQRWPGVGLSQVLQAWSVWRAEQPIGKSEESDSRQFLKAFCDGQGIPSAFYQPLLDREDGWTLVGANQRREPTPDATEVTPMNRDVRSGTAARRTEDSPAGRTG